MHEYSITCSIIEIIERIVKKKKLEKVRQIDFDINEFACIEPESIRFYYDFLTKDDSTLGNAKLNFTKISPDMICNQCRLVFKMDNFNTRCPGCNSTNIRFRENDDIRITAVHTEDL